MDLSRFSLDPGLAAAAGAQDDYRSMYFDKLLAELIEADENLFVKTDISKDRALIFALPALHWRLKDKGEPGRRRVLYLSADGESADRAWAEISEATAGLSGTLKAARLGQAPGGEAAAADFLVAAVEEFVEAIAAGGLAPRSYGFVVVDGSESISEQSYEFQRKLMGGLLPSWERKSLVVAGKNTPKAKNFAWDFADNPKEIKLGEALGYAGQADTSTIKLEQEEKIRYLLGLLRADGAHRIVAFCNLKSSAQELAARLTLNGVPNDHVIGNLNPERKKQIVVKASTWDKSKHRDADDENAPALSQPGAERFPDDAFVLVLTDDGAKGASSPAFPVLVNVDIPLEPELYFERLGFLDRQSEGAKLYNFVCERYVFGLPAIQRHLGAQLQASSLDSSLELPEDLSVGKPIRLQEPRDRFERGGRRDNRYADRRDDRRDRYGDRGERGGRDERGGRGPGPRGAQRDDRGPRRHQEAEREPRADRPERSGVDPYKMTMEERMAFYRKKYGASVEAPGSEHKPRPQGGAGRRDRPQGPKPGAERGGRPEPKAESGSQTSQPVAQNPSDQEQRQKGFLGRIQDILNGQKD